MLNHYSNLLGLNINIVYINILTERKKKKKEEMIRNNEERRERTKIV